jgi:hypothetical protein
LKLNAAHEQLANRNARGGHRMRDKESLTMFPDEEYEQEYRKHLRRSQHEPMEINQRTIRQR